LKELEAVRSTRDDAAIPAYATAPAFEPHMAETYAGRIADLTTALQHGEDPEGLELARALIDKVVVHPPQSDGDPPGIELAGELMALLQAAGVPGAASADNAPELDPVLALFVSSVKEGPGAEPLVGEATQVHPIRLRPDRLSSTQARISSETAA
jgi:hypothetical protein